MINLKVKHPSIIVIKGIGYIDIRIPISRKALIERLRREGFIEGLTKSDYYFHPNRVEGGCNTSILFTLSDHVSKIY